MPKSIAPLSEAQIRTTKRKEKDYKLYDGGGLYLLVYANENRQKIWLFDYSFQNKRKSISFGTYPQTSLAEARKKRQEAKAKILLGIDPSEERKEVKKELEHPSTLKSISEEWFNIKAGKLAQTTIKKKKSFLINHVYDGIGKKDIKIITRLDIIATLKEIQAKGAFEVADRVLNMLNNIWRYAVTMQIVEHNIIADIEKSMVIQAQERKHFPTITNPKDIGTLLHAIDNYKGDINTKLALMISPYIYLRSANMRMLEWKEIDFEKREIKIPAHKMKMKAPHIVPLTDRTIEILKLAHTISGHCSIYVFPSSISNVKIMSENTLNYALRRLGYGKDEIVYHGFRAMASTLLHEKISEHGIHSDAIERQLAHAERSGVKAAYNHAEYLKERKSLMQWWSDYLDELKDNTLSLL
ncbi:MAG: tyrosine-type recombinase/integrase [Sulfurospirillaceae bacterium]|nr:tyrosine-type recombinase/integrase [Sulfurospirillaceae bacterium]MDD2827453.1 tyrosine-type recombinase/integrase [Sulfurospirillaceae bacterium]